MALSTKLIMRQGQSLVMTPQLLQAIKLLQFSNLELAAFIEEELERNPLLERVDDGGERIEAGGPDVVDAVLDDAGAGRLDYTDAQEPDWRSDAFETDRVSLEASLGTELSNSFDEDIAGVAETRQPTEDPGLSSVSWHGAGGAPADGEAPNLEAYVAAETTLRAHLERQLSLATADPVLRMTGLALIHSIDESGYLLDGLDEIASRLEVSADTLSAALKLVQSFDPPGVGARNLAECLEIQLRDKGRFDPAMQALVANLALLAKRDLPALRKICGVDEEDMLDMVAEIRRLDPKPGRAFGSEVVQSVVADVVVRAMPDGAWLVELNSDVLPRILVNQTYAARVSKTKGNDADKSFVSNCLQTANWLTKSLEQRARTILKVSSEIVRQQDAFFAHGVAHLRPLNLKTIADAIGMHESTVSRVTSNKYMATPRGLFELKYFFTASIASHNGGNAHSAESVRFRIKQMIDQEAANEVLSDDAIVARLKDSNIDIARRTVAKYRESLRIPSSVERRREKLMH
jgi:RNA polymerase sigma-54 factor